MQNLINLECFFSISIVTKQLNYNTIRLIIDQLLKNKNIDQIKISEN